MIEVPTEGYKTITVSREVYDKLKNLAEGTYRSVPKLIEHLIRIEKISEGSSESAGFPEKSTPKPEEAMG